MSLFDKLLNLNINNTYVNKDIRELNNIGIFNYNVIEKTKNDFDFLLKICNDIILHDYKYSLVINNTHKLNDENINNFLKLNFHNIPKNFDFLCLSYKISKGYRYDINLIKMLSGETDIFVISKQCALNIKNIIKYYLGNNIIFDNDELNIITNTNEKTYNNFVSNMIFRNEKTYVLYPQIYNTNIIQNDFFSKKYYKKFKLYYNSENKKNINIIQILFDSYEIFNHKIPCEDIFKKIILDDSDLSLVYTGDYCFENDFIKKYNDILSKYEKCDIIFITDDIFLIKKNVCIEILKKNINFYDTELLKSNFKIINISEHIKIFNKSYSIIKNKIKMSESEIFLDEYNKFTSLNPIVNEIKIDSENEYDLFYVNNTFDIYLYSFIKQNNKKNKTLVFIDTLFDFLLDDIPYIKINNFDMVYKHLKNIKNLYISDLSLLLHSQITEQFSFIYSNINYEITYENEKFPIKNIINNARSLIKEIIYPSEFHKNNFENKYFKINNSIQKYIFIHNKQYAKKKQIVILNKYNFKNIINIQNKYPEHKLIIYDDIIQDKNIINKNYSIFDILYDICESEYIFTSEYDNNNMFFLLEGDKHKTINIS